MEYKAGFVGIVGQPNAGKSSLLNVFVEDKVSIVTAKPQTTRRRIMGLLSKEQGQIVFVDSPGFVKSSKGLNYFLEKEAKDVMDSSDVLIVLLSVDEKKPEFISEVLDLVKTTNKAKIYIIHKADLLNFENRIEKIRNMILASDKEAEVFVFSSVKVDLESKAMILDSLFRRLPGSAAPLYEIDLISPHKSRDLAAEMVREQCFQELHQELPYSLAVQIGKFEDQDPGLYRIFAEIIVAKEGHKAIVIGKGGVVLKKIGTEARKQMEKVFGVKVFLSLNVAVKENWQDNKRLMKELGYVVDEK